MAVTIDPRPTVFGDRMIVTGSYDAAETAIDLSGILASIDAFILNPSITVAQAVDPDDDGDAGDVVALELMDSGFLNGAGTGITLTAAIGGGNVVAGTFLAIGRRS